MNKILKISIILTIILIFISVTVVYVNKNNLFHSQKSFYDSNTQEEFIYSEQNTLDQEIKKKIEENLRNFNYHLSISEEENVLDIDLIGKINEVFPSGKKSKDEYLLAELKTDNGQKNLTKRIVFRLTKKIQIHWTKIMM